LGKEKAGPPPPLVEGPAPSGPLPPPFGSPNAPAVGNHGSIWHQRPPCKSPERWGRRGGWSRPPAPDPNTVCVTIYDPKPTAYLGGVFFLVGAFPQRRPPPPRCRSIAGHRVLRPPPFSRPGDPPNGPPEGVHDPTLPSYRHHTANLFCLDVPPHGTGQIPASCQAEPLVAPAPLRGLSERGPERRPPRPKTPPNGPRAARRSQPPPSRPVCFSPRLLSSKPSSRKVFNPTGLKNKYRWENLWGGPPWPWPLGDNSRPGRGRFRTPNRRGLCYSSCWRPPLPPVLSWVQARSLREIPRFPQWGDSFSRCRGPSRVFSPARWAPAPTDCSGGVESPPPRRRSAQPTGRSVFPSVGCNSGPLGTCRPRAPGAHAGFFFFCLALPSLRPGNGPTGSRRVPA